MASSVKFARPFYDGLGNPLIGATITLRNQNGSITYYTMTEQTGDGMSGVYSVDIDASREYYIWVKASTLSEAKCIGSISPKYIASVDA